MTAEAPVLDLTGFDFDQPLIGIDEIRSINPHRYEFEMLSGIVYLDPKRHVVVGFKDVRPNDFWTRGHMPGFPLFPGVLMCEAGAQLLRLLLHPPANWRSGVLLGLAGIDEARFVRPVRPGERLVIVGTGLKIHRRLTRFRVEGFVGTEKAFEALVAGVPLGKMEDLVGA